MIKHEHKWQVSTDQSNTGKIGVRMYCNYKFNDGFECGKILTFPKAPDPDSEGAKSSEQTTLRTQAQSFPKELESTFKLMEEIETNKHFINFEFLKKRLLSAHERAIKQNENLVRTDELDNVAQFVDDNRINKRCYPDWSAFYKKRKAKLAEFKAQLQGGSNE